MSKLIRKLQQLKNDVDLNKRYVWKIPSDCPIEIPTEFQSAYQKNVFLKENLSGKIDEKTYYWIIKKWGGIKSFNETHKNTKKLTTFYTIAYPIAS